MLANSHRFASVRLRHPKPSQPSGSRTVTNGCASSQIDVANRFRMDQIYDAIARDNEKLRGLYEFMINGRIRHESDVSHNYESNKNINRAFSK